MTKLLNTVARLLFCISLSVGAAQTKDSNELSGLEEKQAVQVREMFVSAQAHFKEGNYEACLADLENMKKIIPKYKNSDELRTFCKQLKDHGLKQQPRDL